MAVTREGLRVTTDDLPVPRADLRVAPDALPANVGRFPVTDDEVRATTLASSVTEPLSWPTVAEPPIADRDLRVAQRASAGAEGGSAPAVAVSASTGDAAPSAIGLVVLTADHLPLALRGSRGRRRRSAGHVTRVASPSEARSEVPRRLRPQSLHAAAPAGRLAAPREVAVS